MGDDSPFGSGWGASVAGTLAGLALVGLGVAMAGSGGYELLLASGVADRSAPNAVPRALYGVAAGALGLLVLSRVVDRDDAAEDAQEATPAESADMYQFDT
ncbi:hypothetical protein [Halosimplex salinum]|uniref:hypothetical protein n=1 Tax=Halosimplex salinum TaxID=1710538 RepID=UPI000F4807DF|nr:hypothetical protein [Halosimplex salinum]